MSDPSAAEGVRRAFFSHAPAVAVKMLAGALARVEPLHLEPGWRFDAGAGDSREATRWRRDIWTYYRDNRISDPVTYRWYDGLRLRLPLGNDLSLCLFAGGSFEPNEFTFLRAVLRPGMVFLDGGANDGLYSLYAARHVMPGGHVLAVEPSARELAHFQANLDLNRISGILPLQLALGSHSGEVTLAIAERGHEGQNTVGERVSNPTVATSGHETVRLGTIDGLVEEHGLERLDVVKLDVEGSEVDALEGARKTVARFRPLILAEAEDERLASQNRTKTDFVAIVDSLGYDLWVFDRDTGQLRRAEAPDEPEGNTIAAPRGWQPPRLP